MVLLFAVLLAVMMAVLGWLWLLAEIARRLLLAEIAWWWLLLLAEIARRLLLAEIARRLMEIPLLVPLHKILLRVVQRRVRIPCWHRGLLLCLLLLICIAL